MEVKMPQQKRILAFLKENNVQFSISQHPKAYTAQRVAATAHIPGKILAKTIVVIIDGKMALAALPANDRISFEEFSRQLHAKKVKLATEEEFRKSFPDCETGAMPPFGNLYDMDTYVASDLAHNDEIAFNACNHIDVIEMKFEDYNRLASPVVVHFEMH